MTYVYCVLARVEVRLQSTRVVLRTVEKNRSQSTPLSLKKFLSPLCVLCVGSVRLQSTRVVLRTVEKNRSQSTPLSLKKFLSPRKQFNFMACCFSFSLLTSVVVLYYRDSQTISPPLNFQRKVLPCQVCFYINNLTFAISIAIKKMS